LHSRVLVCDEISDLLVALSKCLNAPILIVVEIHGAIHVLTHAAISVPEVVPAHLDLHRELADRPGPVRAALLALEMTTVGAIHAVTHVVAIVIVHLVVILAIALLVIVVLVVNSVIVLLAILAVEIVIVPLVVMALIHGAILAVVIALLATVLLVVNSEIDPLGIVRPVVILAIAPLGIVRRAVSTETVRCVVMIHVVIVPVVTAVQVAIVRRVVNMVTVRFVVMTLAVILAVVIVIVRRVVNLAIVIVRLVVMVQALVALLVRVVMTAVMAVGVVDLVAKTSHHADQRTKPNVVVKPCAHVAVAKCVKTANRLRCHAKPRPGSMKVESKTKSVMLPKALCAVRSHRDAPCRRDQKMKTN